MDSIITRRSALGLALTAVPCAAVALTSRMAHAESESLEAAQLIVPANSSLQESSRVLSTASTVTYSGVSVSVKAKIRKSNWTSWRKESKTVGSAKSAGLVALRVKLTALNGLTGQISYRVYKRGAGWQEICTDGASTSESRLIEAVKLSLKGDVATHYDVLYRVYQSGKGWSKWYKNGAKAGTINKKIRVNALQVKLCAKTEEAAGKSLKRVGVRYEALVRKTGWQDWVGNGKTAGTVGRRLALGGVAVVADAGKVTGGVRYCAHVASFGWQEWKDSGQFAGSTAHNLEAIRIKLTGELAKRYDIYYRAHVATYGWLDWAKNGAIAGSVGFALRMEAFQIKLVKKDADPPGAASYCTVNKLERRHKLNGVDIASYQGDNGINIAAIPADFVIVKATQGNWYKNPYFKRHANATLSSKKLLGIYHYADLRGSAVSQANFFVKAVKPYLGQCILVLDWEAEALELGTGWAKTFLDRVHRKTGVKPLIYLSQSKTKEYDWSNVAPYYRLWVAQYLYRNMYTGYLPKPEGGTDLGYWSAATIYQYSSTGRIANYGYDIDMNKFYGSATLWKMLMSKS